MGESEGTNALLQKGIASPIYSIDDFIASFGFLECKQEDAFLTYCEMHPFYHEAVEKFADKVFEYECLGKITIENGRIKCM